MFSVQIADIQVNEKVNHLEITGVLPYVNIENHWPKNWKKLIEKWKITNKVLVKAGDEIMAMVATTEVIEWSQFWEEKY